MKKLLLLLSLLTVACSAQDFIDSDEFKNKTSKGVSVVEFWAEWNKGNEVSFLGDLKDCDPYKLSIVKNSGVQKKYKVIAIPTLIVFDNGIEQQRFNPNIMMQLAATKKEVQSVIDEITLNKFQ